MSSSEYPRLTSQRTMLLKECEAVESRMLIGLAMVNSIAWRTEQRRETHREHPLYATACALFAGIFIVRYHVELIRLVPLAAGFFAYYMRLGLMPNSPVQHPEKLYRVRGFLLYSVICTVLFIALMFIEISALYDLFNIEPSNAEPLWKIGRGLARH